MIGGSRISVDRNGNNLPHVACKASGEVERLQISSYSVSSAWLNRICNIKVRAIIYTHTRLLNAVKFWLSSSNL